MFSVDKNFQGSSPVNLFPQGSKQTQRYCGAFKTLTLISKSAVMDYKLIEDACWASQGIIAYKRDISYVCSCSVCQPEKIIRTPLFRAEFVFVFGPAASSLCTAEDVGFLGVQEQQELTRTDGTELHVSQPEGVRGVPSVLSSSLEAPMSSSR